MVQPGIPLVLLDAAQVLEVVVHIPAARLEEVQVRQKVRVSVDAYPGETFRGRVVRIADQALFTPSEVLSRKARVKRVFAVTIRLEEGLDRLHPGRPADVTFGL
ncbi:MAG TPA: efflux RND transporter periplasmic adaptor subunit [Anaerolineae bacterium]|nr:efflux RND transporter periplasmic adaptor subunit [Anaerolineae bacterium]